MKILITGVLGYIGSALAKEFLANGHTVYGVDNLRYGIDVGREAFTQITTAAFQYQKEFAFSTADARDVPSYLHLLRQADVVIPLAALVGAPICDKFPQEATAVNRFAIQSLCQYLGVFQRVVYPNTNSGYGQTDGNSFCTEKDVLTPISRYAIDKCEAEKLVLTNTRHPLVFRLATVFGMSPRPRMDLMVNDFTRRLTYIKRHGYVSGEDNNIASFQVFDPHFKRNFVHVNDVVRAFMFGISFDLEGVYNLGLPTANLTKLELAHYICDEIRLDRNVVTIGEGNDPDKRNYIVSNDKILKSGFEFLYGLSDGIHEVHELCLKNPEHTTQKMRNA